MPIIEVTDLKHSGVEVFSTLTEAQLRNRMEPEKGIFIVESPKVIRVALDAGCQPVALLCERRHIEGDAADIIQRCGEIPVYTGSRELLATLTGYTLTRGVLCAMRRPTPPCVAEVCRQARRIVVIDGVVDTTNIGAIFRSAAALGVDAVLLTTNSCDPLNRRAVRVSMGSVFLVPWTWIDDINQLHDYGFKTAAMALTDDAIPLDDVTLKQEERLAIVMGTEGDGLPKETIADADYVVRIPMAHGVDSLNVAAASAVAFWELVQRLILTLFILTIGVCLHPCSAQDRASKVRNKECPSYIYRVTLRDKQNSPFSLERPARFLSRRSVDRRKRQGLELDSTDLPVTPKYIRQIEADGVNVLGQSRWNNTVLVQMKDTSEMTRISRLPFVKQYKMVWQAPDSIEPTTIKTKYEESFHEWDSVPAVVYGRADRQIRALNGHRLHDINCMGERMMIAILDGGFKNVDRIPAFRKVDIKGTHDFVYPASPSIFYELDHGTRVLSTMTIQQPYYYIGTAPKASYWLLRCEDAQSEQEVEEDYWTMAAEFADSAGCDLINSSLGYNDFDKCCNSHQLWQLDGESTLISHSASLVAQKGMILINSAGNTGMGPWKKLTFPADAKDCLTVGAVTDMLTNAPFSAVGPTQDGRVKPDVVAIGSPATIVTGRGSIAQDMGTSFAAPVICGLAACLWQALPYKTAKEIMELIRQSGNNHEHPDNIKGYGLPNFWRAYMIGNFAKNNE